MLACQLASVAATACSHAWAAHTVRQAQPVPPKACLDGRCVQADPKVVLRQIAQAKRGERGRSPIEQHSGERIVHVADIGFADAMHPHATKQLPGSLV